MSPRRGLSTRSIHAGVSGQPNGVRSLTSSPTPAALEASMFPRSSTPTAWPEGNSESAVDANAAASHDGAT